MAKFLRGVAAVMSFWLLVSILVWLIIYHTKAMVIFSIVTFIAWMSAIIYEVATSDG